MNVTAEVVYILATLTSALCTLLLFRAYRRGGSRLLMWSALAFAGLTINNVLLFIDVLVLGNAVDLSVGRQVPALLGVALLCYGFIEEET